MMAIEFKPADNYDSLKIQAYALHSITITQQKTISHLEKIIKDLNQRISLTSADEINSLRTINEVLTIEIEKMKELQEAGK